MNFRHLQLNECGSTNDEVWKYLDKSDFKTTLVSTKLQTAGRGRQGRIWESGNKPRSNAIFSLLFKTAIENMTWTPLICGIASAEAIEKIKPRSNVRLKWPNDLYINNEKLGGILCESKFFNEKEAVIVAGIGINLFHHPNLIGKFRATSLFKDSDLGKEQPDITRTDLIESIATGILHWNALLEKNDIDPVKKRWLEFGKLDEFGTINTHDENGNEISFKMQNLDDIGRALGQLTDKDGVTKDVSLDQPLT